MKLLLTSSGITNASISKALVDMLGKPVEESDALFVPTAIYPFSGGANYAWQAITGMPDAPFTQLGWRSIGVLELSVLPSIDKDIWLPALMQADALLVWGGDPLFLTYWFNQSGLAVLLPSLLDKLIYVGVSAGSIATSHIFGEAYHEIPSAKHDKLSAEEMMMGEQKITFVTANGIGLTNFAIIPHFDHPHHADASASNAEMWAKKLSVPVYAIDDQTALKVIDGVVEIISEGKWEIFNKE